MSGIFIKDMWLPEHCGKCPLALLDGYGERKCFVTESDVTGNATWAGDRASDCPMREMDVED